MSFLVRHRAGAPARVETPTVDILQRSINDMFDDFWSGTPLSRRWDEAARPMADFNPRMDVKETDKTFEVMAELPGVKKEEIQLSLADNTLTMRGEKKSERKEEKAGWHRTECSYGSFYRAVEFPTPVDEEKVRADYKDGVLTVTVEKSVESVKKMRKIDIR